MYYAYAPSFSEGGVTSVLLSLALPLQKEAFPLVERNLSKGGALMFHLWSDDLPRLEQIA